MGQQRRGGAGSGADRRQAFGRAVELRFLAQVLEEGFEAYVPLVDQGVDAVVRWGEGAFVPVQIKASSARARPEDAGLFAALRPRAGCWHVFHVALLEAWWLFSPEELAEAAGRDGDGAWCVQLTGMRDGRPYPLERFRHLVVAGFARLREASLGR